MVPPRTGHLAIRQRDDRPGAYRLAKSFVVGPGTKLLRTVALLDIDDQAVWRVVEESIRVLLRFMKQNVNNMKFKHVQHKPLTQKEWLGSLVSLDPLIPPVSHRQSPKPQLIASEFPVNEHIGALQCVQHFFGEDSYLWSGMP